MKLSEINVTSSTWVYATLERSTVHGMISGRTRSEAGDGWMVEIPGSRYRPGYDGLVLWDDEPWDVRIVQPPIVLPTEPGTVIAIGDWWLVKLEPWDGLGQGCWELLPARSEATRKGMDLAGVKAQCVYGDEWVLAEAEQEGSFNLVSTPACRNIRTLEDDRG